MMEFDGLVDDYAKIVIQYGYSNNPHPCHLKLKLTSHPTFSLPPTPALFVTHLFCFAAVFPSYVTMFSVAFPLAPLMSLLANVVQLRGSSNMLITTVRRPLSRGANSIGAWFAIMEFMSIAAVVTNIALLFVNSKQ